MGDFLTEAQAWAMGGVAVFMVLDIISGFVQAVVNRCLDSTKMREGVLHKASIGLVVLSTWALEVLAQHVADLSIEGLGTVPVCVILVLMELVSIWENVCRANPALADSPLGHLLSETVGGTAVKPEGAADDME